MPEIGKTTKKYADKLGQVLKWLVSYLPSPVILFFIALIVWLASGVFVVGPDEVGVVKTFGRQTRTEKPGVHYHMPYPISTVMRPQTGRIFRLEFEREKNIPEQPAAAAADQAPEPVEAAKGNDSGILMLTADENLVGIRFSLQYRISNEKKYLFRLADQEQSIRTAAESCMRAAVARAKIDDILTTGRQALVDEAKTDLQDLLGKYDVGVKVVALRLLAAEPPAEVQEAFKAVTDAQEKVNRLVNDASGYANEVIPEARAGAVRLEREAEAYLEKRRRLAEGEAERFSALLAESRKARDVTRARLYLEAMEDVLSQAGSLVLEPKDQGVTPFLWDIKERPPLTADGRPGRAMEQ